MIEFGYEERRDLLRWALSAVIVLTVYGGIAVAMVAWHDPVDADEPTAAMVIELAPMPVTSAVEPPPDIAPGPEQVEAEAAPPTPEERPEETREEQVAETKEVTEPQPEIAPAPNPEVAVTPPPKPEPEAPKPQESQTPVPVTTAPQALPAEIAPLAAAPAQGQAHVTSSNAIPQWRTRVVNLLERHKRYPSAAQSRHEQGTAQLAFSLDRQGKVTSSKILRSSGSTVLDRETLELVKRAQPFPPPPPELTGGEINLSVPIKFNMR